MVNTIDSGAILRMDVDAIFRDCIVGLARVLVWDPRPVTDRGPMGPCMNFLYFGNSNLGQLPRPLQLRGDCCGVYNRHIQALIPVRISTQISHECADLCMHIVKIPPFQRSRTWCLPAVI